MQKLMADSNHSLVSVNNYERYVNLSIQWNRWLLKSIGLWPRSLNTSTTEKFFYYTINVICLVLIIFLLIPCSMYVILDVHDLNKKMKLIGPLSFCVMAIMKYYSLMSHEKDIYECVECIEWDWRNVEYVQDREIMITNANQGKRLVAICSFFMFSGFVFYYVALPINVGTLMAENENFTFIPMVFPFSKYIADTRYSPINEIIFGVQLLGGALIHSIAAATCSLVAVFAVHACGQMEVLMRWLEHFLDYRENMYETVDDRLEKIVSQHVRILEFLTLLENALQQVSLVEFSGCTLNLCLLGYYIITEWNVKDVTLMTTYSVILTSFAFNIFIFCYLGELVAEQYQMVGETSYMIDWHRLPGKQKLSFVMIIAMSNFAKKLTAGNLIELCLRTFGDVIKTSVALLNMLRTLT